jgi:phosphoglycerate dehydrogenase-like enzyme
MTGITVCIPLSEGQMARLRRGAEGYTLRTLAPDEPCTCEVVFGNPDPGIVAGNAALRWLQLESVGFGEYTSLDWTRPGGTVQVTNLAGFFADPVAESALAGILALYRGIDRLVRLQDRAEWQGEAIRPTLRRLSGARVVLFGFGAINRRLADLLVPFGCTITTLARGWTSESLAEALSGADIIVSTVPATPETADVFDTSRLAQMPQGAILCNFGRGSAVDEAALESALRSGHLGGAVIDVTREEPLAPDHPFWTCPNLLLTQHSGGGTSDEIDRKIDHFLANLALYRAGRPLVGRVDFARGY